MRDQHKGLRYLCIAMTMFLQLTRVQGQNLVANGSFEDVNICEEFKTDCSPSGWFFARQKSAHGYFSTNHIPGTDGNKYLSLVLAQPGVNVRQYWETMLLCGLKAGQKYRVSVQVLPEQNVLDLHDIGFYFTHGFIFSWDDTLLQPAQYLSLAGAFEKTLKYNWFRVEKEFTASGNDDYLIIGNFSELSNHDILLGFRLATNYSVLLDNLSIVPVGGQGCLDYSLRKDSLYNIVKRHRIEFMPKARMDVSSPQSSPNSRIDTLFISGILFDYDSYQVRDEDSLDRFKLFFTQAGIKKIRIIGYTDDEGTDHYNKTLSTKRALEIKWLLIRRFGTPTDILETEGFGISRSFADKRRNRRVEIYIYR